jgi:hypothetical protein
MVARIGSRLFPLMEIAAGKDRLAEVMESGAGAGVEVRLVPMKLD